MAKVLIAGYGSAGQYLVDFLLKDHRINHIDEIHIMSRKKKEDVEPRLDISRVAAGISERFIPLIYHCADFDSIDQMATIIEEVKPSVIVYTGRYASGFKYGAFSYPYDIGYGVWMPLAVPYIYNLMRAVKQTSVNPKVINTSFPDGTNYLLKGEDLAPTCGAGNLNHLIPRIRRSLVKIINEKETDLKTMSKYYDYLCTTIVDINVKLVGSHYLNTYVSKIGNDRDCPSYLYFTRDDDHYSHIDGKLLQDVYRRSKDQSASGQIRNQMIATDCAEIVRRMTERSHDSESIIHIPGVNGEPGGYPVIFNAEGSPIIDLTGMNLSLEDARQVNIEGLRRDGVVIDENRIHFTDDVRSKMKDIYKIDYPESISISDCEKFAREISKVLSTVAEKEKEV